MVLGNCLHWNTIIPMTIPDNMCVSHGWLQDITIGFVISPNWPQHDHLAVKFSKKCPVTLIYCYQMWWWIMTDQFYRLWPGYWCRKLAAIMPDYHCLLAFFSMDNSDGTVDWRDTLQIELKIKALCGSMVITLHLRLSQIQINPNQQMRAIRDA